VSGCWTGVDAHGAADQGCFTEAHRAPVNHKVTDAACEGSAGGPSVVSVETLEKEMNTKFAIEASQAQILLCGKNTCHNHLHYQDDLHVKDGI